MKIKISVRLSEDVLKAIDGQLGPEQNRSESIENALRAYMKRVIRDQQNAEDLEIINQQADRLNQEATDVLSYQVDP